MSLIYVFFQMPRAKGHNRRLAALRRRADQLGQLAGRADHSRPQRPAAELENRKFIYYIVVFSVIA